MGFLSECKLMPSFSHNSKGEFNTVSLTYKSLMRTWERLETGSKSCYTVPSWLIEVFNFIMCNIYPNVAMNLQFWIPVLSLFCYIWDSNNVNLNLHRNEKKKKQTNLFSTASTFLP